MALIGGIYLQGGDDLAEVDLENLPYTPMPGEIIIVRGRVSGEDMISSQMVYRVLERRLQFTKVGGSSPAGSEDSYYVYLICEEIPQGVQPLTDSVS
jgi:hypothetical protein